MSPPLIRWTVGLSALGTAIALCAAIAGFSGISSVPGVIGVFGLALATAVCGALAPIQNQVQRRVPGKAAVKHLLSSSPPWLKLLSTVLPICGLATWFLFFNKTYSMPAQGIHPLVLTAGGLTIFPSTLAQAYSYLLLLPKLNRRCPNGHEVPFEAHFCPTCGENVEPVS